MAFNAVPNASKVLTQITVPGSGGLTKFHRPVFGNNNGKKYGLLILHSSRGDIYHVASLAVATPIRCFMSKKKLANFHPS